MGETDVYTRNFEVGDTINLANPTKDGYTFLVWNPVLPTAMLAEDVTTIAMWMSE